MNSSINCNMQRTVCQKCGRTNIGHQETCLVCGNNLGVEHKQNTSKSESKNERNKVVSTCSACGEKLAKGDLFCTNCGAKKEKIVTPSCSNCGAEISDEQLFCIECGDKLED